MTARHVITGRQSCRREDGAIAHVSVDQHDAAAMQLRVGERVLVQDGYGAVLAGEVVDADGELAVLVWAQAEGSRLRVRRPRS